ncbi:hypothetical protein K8W59_05145 [Nocardioides rotundus]|uniref:hypothetical protein n=1 Tax=Nocardioides rotundus TaxID=1774216 RepID=UPI001CBD5C02|nr:hypothetical protein [Nocardioides rotundus]UAL30887.1 hypothetical protein K8W59_05145 [Nocardioides rotundus]
MPMVGVAEVLITLLLLGILITPWLSGVIAFQYLDLRIRREGLGQQILQASAPGAAPGERM